MLKMLSTEEGRSQRRAELLRGIENVLVIVGRIRCFEDWGK